MKMTYSVEQSFQERNWKEARFNIETSCREVKDKILDSLYLRIWANSHIFSFDPSL